MPLTHAARRTAASGQPGDSARAPVHRRLLALVYDLLVLTGLAFAAAVPVVLWVGEPPEGLMRLVLQCWLLVVCGGYVCVAWHRSGATLGMQAWKIEVVTIDGDRPGWPRAVLRLLLALALLAPAGLALWWMLVDREGCALHDRLSGTRVRRRPGLSSPA
jgi:uncharacterized RDD family membrane protein YckC